MGTHVILIDYENTQPPDIHLLAGQDCLVRMFLGMNQRSLSVDVSKALQPLGSRVEYVNGKHAGKNAMDFLLTHHLGRLLDSHRDGHFWIVSKDRGFDSVVSHLSAEGFRCGRVVSIGEIFPPKSDGNLDSQIEAITHHLIGMKKARPTRPKTLRSTIKKVFAVNDEAELELIVKELQQRRVLVEAGGKISYGEGA